jgi:1,4-dihydroxy-2-naphthoyl-CoA synthase
MVRARSRPQFIERNRQVAHAPSSPFAKIGFEVTDAVLNVEYKGKLAILTMVYRPYNLTGPTLYRALLKALDKAVEVGSRAVLIKSGLSHFCAGADISLWDERIANHGKPAFNPIDVLRGFEQLPIPIVAAVHGACLGGGLEIAMGVRLHPRGCAFAADTPQVYADRIAKRGEAP